jgi:alpha-maltose-1-phosphate synthase
MKIFITGTRGIPDIPGGVEKHCQELYPRIAAKGHTVLVSRRKPYTGKSRGLTTYKGVGLVDLPTIKKPSAEAILHTFISLLAARVISPDIVHIHAIGPSLMVPLGRLLGLKVVSTNHGQDYARLKWSRFAKIALKIGEYVGGRFGNKTIVISSVIADIVRNRCNIEPVLIPNGVTIPEKTRDAQALQGLGVTSNNYVLAVARLVPEKGLHDLVQAFSCYEGDLKLLIAGDADHESAYSRELKEKSRADPRIVFAGYITGQLLSAVYAHARLFVLPSYHEGHPIALLEALSFGLPVLVSDIPANLEVGLRTENYFQCGNTKSLLEGVRRLLDNPFDEQYKKQIQALVRQKYDWDKIAEQTIKVYGEICKLI